MELWRFKSTLEAHEAAWRTYFQHEQEIRKVYGEKDCGVEDMRRIRLDAGRCVKELFKKYIRESSLSRESEAERAWWLFLAKTLTQVWRRDCRSVGFYGLIYACLEEILDMLEHVPKPEVDAVAAIRSAMDIIRKRLKPAEQVVFEN